MPRTNAPLLDAIAQVAAGQLGLVSAAQFAELGMARSTLQWRIRQGGPWSRVLPGVYLLGREPLNAEQMLVAARLYAGTPAAFTGFTALGLHGFGTAERRRTSEIHLIIPGDRKRVSHRFVHVERCKHWPSTAVVDGFEVAPPARAAIDACRRLDDKFAVRALLTKVVGSGRVSRDELYNELAKSQRRRTALAREALDLMAAGPASVAEIDLYERWRAAELPDASWNPDVYVPDGGFLARPDVYLAEFGLAVEVDSLAHHYSRPEWEATMERHALMTSYGLQVLHFTPSRIRNDWSGVLREIVRTLESRRGTPPDLVVVRPRRA